MAKLVNLVSCIFSHRNKKLWGVVITKKKRSLQRLLSIVIMKKRFRNAVLVS